MSVASPFADVEIPASSVFDALFAEIDEQDLDRTALIDSANSAQTSYRELRVRVIAMAGALALRGVGPGSVVGLLAPNSSQFAIAFHGILRAGATATTVNALFTADDIAKQLIDAKASLLITATALLPHALEAAATAGIAREDVILLDGGPRIATGHPSLADILARTVHAPQAVFDPAIHPAALPYSSGTTGNPKGVILTHRNLVANMAQIRPLLDIKRDDRIIAVLPFFHIYGMTVLLNAALQARATLVVMPRFDLTEFLDTIERHRITYGFIAPPVAVTLAKHTLVDQYDLSSLNTILSGAAPLDSELGAAVEERLKVRMIHGYGMSELSPVSHLMPADRGLRLFGELAPLSSCGWPVPNTINRIVDPATGNDILPPTEGLSKPGELLVSGPNVMLGYLGNPQATAETIDADGFLHTGDLARIDSMGRVFIVDRLKELIKYKGYQVPPAELEALLLTHPAIGDAAVIGVPDNDGEEIPMAYIVRRGDAPLSADDVMAFIAARVAPHKKIRRVAFIDAIPKSPSGKILRKDLRTAA
ncbi:AMP-dependent synthetase (plasmid) [Sphingomonas panacis]|uniref:AMP-dependent synthetase n=1 Tax=Sphingomonas panacis TaxID=1560345 RepID=A0A1B3ZIF7_9SPHN|nr:4-coumarate--CoA ligase family protein [Sphingomonas panacis]AOH87214.1 AMP-dependent synthetase [Sphingomonas panacis]